MEELENQRSIKQRKEESISWFEKKEVEEKDYIEDRSIKRMERRKD